MIKFKPQGYNNQKLIDIEGKEHKLGRSLVAEVLYWADNFGVDFELEYDPTTKEVFVDGEDIGLCTKDYDRCYVEPASEDILYVQGVSGGNILHCDPDVFVMVEGGCACSLSVAKFRIPGHGPVAYAYAIDIYDGYDDEDEDDDDDDY